MMVVYEMELMTSIFEIVQNIISTIGSIIGFESPVHTISPKKIINACGSAGFFEIIHQCFITLRGCIFITILSFIMILFCIWNIL